MIIIHELFRGKAEDYLGLITSIGVLAGALTTIAFFPQLLKAVRTKSVEDLSLGMFVILSLGLILWVVYGLLINSWPIIIANVFTLAQAGVILVMKLKSSV